MIRRWAIAGVVLSAVVAAVVFLVDWEDLARGWIVRAVAQKTGRPVTLQQVQLHAGLPVRISLLGFTIGNPEWAKQRQLLELESGSFTLRLLPLLFKREIVLPEVSITRPAVNLEQSKGRRSWEFGDEEAGKESGSLPRIDTLRIVKGIVRYAVDEDKTDIVVHASQDASLGDEKLLLAFDASGLYKAERIKVDGAGASLLRLRDTEDPYALKIRAAVGSTRAAFEGQIGSLTRLERIDGDFIIEGASLVDLYRLLTITLPETPPYKLRGHLLRQAAKWRFDNFKGTMGDSDLSGDFSYDVEPDPPELHARLHSRLLDFDDLGPLVGAPPKTGPGETASPKQERQARQLSTQREVLPERGFKTERWGKLNADVSLQAEQIRRPEQLPIEKLSARLRLRNKVIELDPLHFQVAGGSADSRIRLNGAVEPLQVVLHTQFKGLQLNRLFPAIEQSRNSAGRFYGIADLRAKGDSVQAMMDVVDGNVQLAMGPGQVSNILLEAVGLDAGEILRLFATGDRMIKVRCVVANFGLRQGMAEARALVAATQDTNVIGTGSVDLAKERLDLTFHPEPKDMSILAARAPIHLSGSFKDPKVRPDAKVLAAKGIGAVLLGLVNPVLALVPLIETGPGKDSSCGELIVKAQEWSRQSASSKQARARGRDPRSNSSGQAPRAEDVLREDKAGRSAKGKPAQSERDGASADREDAPRAEELLREQDG